jgi:membrane-associated protease RseP (regulator of RpoE activity)
LKSAGLFLAVVVPGGLVELDDERMEKSTYSSRLRVFAAGSASNLAVAMVALILLSNFALTISPLYRITPSGVQIGGLTKGFPAEAAGVMPGDIIQAVNSIEVSDIEGLRDVMSHVKPGESVKIQTSSGVFELKTASDPSDPERAVLGVTQLTNHIVYAARLPFLSSHLPTYLFNLEFWVYFVTVSVAMINMLPLFPLDGDKYLSTLLDALGLLGAKRIRSAINGFSFIILAANLLLSYTVFGFTKL